MSANSALSEYEMAQAAVAWLRDRLPPTWEVGPTKRGEFQPPDGNVDAAIDLRGPNGTFSTMVVDVKRSFGPRDVNGLFTGIGRTLQALGGNPILVVAPWLSQRSQELLAAESLNYLDLTGNALIRLEYPTVYIETRGATKNPSPPVQSKARVQGPKAGRLIRTLVDVRPPYGVRDLAASASLSVSYVSRLLDALADEALVERTKRGQVQSADVAGLLRRWAETYDVFRSKGARRYLAPSGASSALKRLATPGLEALVTGSFAAVRIAAVSAPTLLSIYSLTPGTVIETLGLIPADQGANIALLTPFDPVVWERTSTEDGITYVAPSQAAVDCLTGNGRMPAEGDAVVRWMTDHEGAWRLPSLPTGVER